MLRSMQGLLFLGIALFALKWEFHGSRDRGFIAPTGDVFFTAKAFFKTLPPWHVIDKLCEAGVLALIGLYLLLTGEITRLSGRGEWYSPLIFLSAMSAFLAVFTAKFAWHEGDPSGYYPPFDAQTLGLAYGFFTLLAAYYLVAGEIQVWRSRRREK
jgi:hypothetical protein